MDTLTLGFVVVAVFLLAGTIKGLIGLGLPLTVVALLTLVIDPREAIALVLMPMLLTNGWQVWRSGHVLRTLRRYLPFALLLMPGIWLAVTVSRDASDQLLFGIMGGAIVVFVLVNLTRWAPYLPDRFDRAGQIVAGALAGVMGGFTAVWGPPMVIYLAARRLPKDEFVRATGLLVFLGALPLVGGYLVHGMLDGAGLALSLALMVPTLAGFTLGEVLRRRLSEEGFRTALLWLFLLMGLNLLRRALF